MKGSPIIDLTHNQPQHNPKSNAQAMMVQNYPRSKTNYKANNKYDAFLPFCTHRLKLH